MIGQTDYDWRNPSQRPKTDRKVQKLWAWMLKQSKLKTPKPFTVAQAASVGQMSPRYTRSYVRILEREGFLRCVFRATSPHSSSTFLVTGEYRGEVAPQIAGGSGGGGSLGRGWKGKTAAAEISSGPGKPTASRR